MYKLGKEERYYKIVRGTLLFYDCNPNEQFHSRYSLLAKVYPTTEVVGFCHKSISRGLKEIPYPRNTQYYIDSRGNLLDPDHPLMKVHLFEEFLLEE